MTKPDPKVTVEPSVDPVHIRVDMPWPATALSPNSRAHYMVLARAKRQARDRAFLLATQAVRERSMESRYPDLTRGADVVMLFRPKVRRRRDQDNLVASMKAALDGIALALGVDDSIFRLLPPVEIPDKEKGPTVTIYVQARQQ